MGSRARTAPPTGADPLGDLGVPVLLGALERGLALVILDVDRRAMLDQPPRRREVAARGRHVHGCVVGAGERRAVRAVVDQQLGDLDAAAGRGMEERRDAVRAGRAGLLGISLQVAAHGFNVAEHRRGADVHVRALF